MNDRIGRAALPHMKTQDIAFLRSRTDRAIEDLPVLPGAVVQLLSLDGDSDDFATQVADLVHREPSLAARVLSTANSVESAPQEPIVTIPQAIARLGARRTGQLITSLAVLRVFVPSREAHVRLWRHGMQVAVAAREIAWASGRGIDPEEAYVLGLLHDVGRLVMFEHSPEDLRLVDESGWSTPGELVQAEREAVGYDHCELGWRVCQAWKLPDHIGIAIRHHHDMRPRDPGLPERYLGVLRAVQQADRVSCMLLSDPGFMARPTPERISLLSERSISPEWDWAPMQVEQLDLLMDRIQARTEEQLGILGLARPS